MVCIQIFVILCNGFVRSARFPLGENTDQLCSPTPVCYALSNDLAHPGFRPLIEEDCLAFQCSPGYTAAQQVCQPVFQSGD